MDKFEKLLDTYTFEEILEENDLDVVDVLKILYERGLIKLPLLPVDVQ